MGALRRYRLICDGVNPVPAGPWNIRILPIQDVKAAIRFVKAHAEEYRLDPTKVAVWGGSAGGHLAALA